MAEEKFHLVSSYAPTGDQPQAIAQLVEDPAADLILSGQLGQGQALTLRALDGQPRLLVS